MTPKKKHGPNDSRKILLGSTSEIKREAVKKACTVVWPQREIEVVCFPAKSGVHKQPIGFFEIYTGALNRAQNCLDQVSTAQVALGIENGLLPFEPGTTTHFQDFAIVILLIRAYQSPFVSFSCSVPMPAKFCRQIMHGRKRSGTIGEIMHKAHPSCDPADPHAFVTDGKLSREYLLLQPLVVVLSQFNDRMLD